MSAPTAAIPLGPAPTTSVLLLPSKDMIVKAIERESVKRSFHSSLWKLISRGFSSCYINLPQPFDVACS
eukprot:5099853-Pleurochrysis_carterae.AAC.5